ncbi:DUF349 domain-containing protein [Glaciecola sp. MH2013]|uniref:DUF349 domain-containing protein n=1 Tax=Glaciecola sp. MH2013 TaxID=2785524 RepID=UPI00189E69AD|nr:DUF349 domain-containing protein [Glaciecola sp. MH2013]MBF7072613.1 DUF349 domain-containing protein [Glaciecola sp. MH2013]
MIFKRLFQAKHLSKDPAVRLTAIEHLSVSKVSDKQALHELAFNDNDVSVSLAALDKLNSFALWLKASETADNKRIKKHAHEWVVAEINKADSALISNDEFERFIAESKNTSLLEEILFSNRRLQTNDALALATLLKINKVNTARLYFREHANNAQQLVLVSRTNDAAELSKLAKYASHQSVSDAIESKLALLHEASQKPTKIHQLATLNISKLLALKEHGDYEYIFENKQSLNQEFNELKAEFSYLDAESAALLAEKYLRTNEAVEKRLAALKSEWLSANELKQTTNALSEIESRFADIRLQINAILASIDDPSLLAQSKLLANALNDILADVEDARARPQTIAHKRTIKALDSDLKRYQGFLNDLPAARESVAKAKEAIAAMLKLDASLSPNDLQEQLKSLESDWKQLNSDTQLPLPKGLVDEWNVAVKKHRTALSEHFSAIKQQEKKLQSKLKMVQRMINQGSYKPAIATFKHCEALFEGLAEKSQRSQRKLFEELAEKVAELQALQAFIAAPRKPALLDQVKTMLDGGDAIDIPERAAAVKRLRKEWNDLGRLGTEEDDKLNEAFDEALEKAFAPCRAHYAEQDKIRADNAEIARTIITDLEPLALDDELATLGRRVNAIGKRWRELGILEHNDKKALNKQYFAALKPIQAKLEAFYADNASQKQSLINKVIKLAALEDNAVASSQAKNLQQEWKAIGFAGKPHDDKLWKQFREANDAVFAKVNEERDAQANEIADLKKQIAELTGTLAKEIESATQSAELTLISDKIDEARALLTQMPPREGKAVSRQIDVLQTTLDTREKVLADLRVSAQWDALFEVLSIWRSDELPNEVADLPSRFQSFFKAKDETELDRKSLTIQLEILSDVESNKADEKRRKELQLAMMAAKLEGNDVLTAEAVLQSWIAKGCLEKQDSALLKRLKKAMAIHVGALGA